ncbi:MAG: TetR family transcriptional regulator [Haliea sp.]|jgi:AcrR family transcriptional regulator|nr:TetR family transcriptional regulator [Haliea sp.]
MTESSQKSSYHHGDLKRALLDETARILREEGEDALSLRRLAANLGVSRTAPYNHFKNKEALLSAVAEEGFSRYAADMKAMRERGRRLDGRGRTRALVRAYIDFARKNPEYYDLMYGSKPWQSSEPAKSLAVTARSVLRAEVERLKRNQQRGQIKADLDVLRFVQVYWGTLHGISRLLLDGVYTDSASVKQLCDAAADMLWQQLDPGQGPEQ